MADYLTLTLLTSIPFLIWQFLKRPKNPFRLLVAFEYRRTSWSAEFKRVPQKDASRKLEDHSQ